MARKTRHIEGLIQYSLFDAQVPPAEHDLSLAIQELTKKACFTLDQAKVLATGMTLIRYTRDKMEIHKTCNDPTLGWYLVGCYKTYAQAERMLKLEREGCVEVLESGAIKSCALLTQAGFSFYRSEGIMAGHGRPRIKISPNWCTWKKFDTPAECKSAWDQLMKTDMKALEG